MARMYRIKNWAKFQHYRDRNPPWIKLHVEILASEDWVMLDDASKLLAVVCMVVAAKHDGQVPDSPDYIKRVAYLSKRPNLKPLIECGFLENTLADASESKQPKADARPEKEGETEGEKERTLSTGADGDPDFEAFWKAYNPPRNSKKPDAKRAWAKTAKVRPPLDVLLRAVAGYQAWIGEQTRKQKRDYPVQHPATWLNGEVWNGFLPDGPMPDELEIRTAWDGRAAPLVDEIGTTVFNAWFAGAHFEPGPPAKIIVPGEFRRKWIADHFSQSLHRAYGELIKIEAAA